MGIDRSMTCCRARNGKISIEFFLRHSRSIFPGCTPRTFGPGTQIEHGPFGLTDIELVGARLRISERVR